MTFNVRTADLGLLNSLTKYPSIPTYHALDPANGRLTDAVVEFDGPVIGTEKIDGTNARIISLPDGTYLLGSREHLLYARGDLIGNPAQGIVAALKQLAESLPPATDGIRVHFLEVYGGKVGAAAKQYSGEHTVGYRMFDYAVIADHEEMVGRSMEQISSWRESGGQPFVSVEQLVEVGARDAVPLVPALFTVDSADLPRDLEATRAFLAEQLPSTRSALDEGAGGQPEGIVLRSGDRSRIAKARFQDYDRTLKRRR
ncbi:RNA ligase family protein [Actinomycetes bacterium KLBMP 9759]